MTKVRLQTPAAADLGLTAGEPVVAEILDHDLNLVNRVSLQTGTAQDVEVPADSASYVVRIPVLEGPDLIAQAVSAAEEGRWALSTFLRQVADWLEPRELDASEPRPEGGFRKGLSDLLERIAESPTREPVTTEIPAPVIQSVVEPRAIPPASLRMARAVLWARDADRWSPEDAGVMRSLGDGRFRLMLGGRRMYALQIGGPNLPWRIVLLPPTDLEVNVHEKPSQSQLDEGIGVSVVLHDPRAEATLRYVEVGAMQSARVIAEKPIAEELLRAKQTNVTGAVIGGYTLLRTGQYDRLHDWPNNLANMYPWLPDAAVIHAWQLLEEPGVPSFGKAQSRLLQAEGAGVPIFGEGLRRLYDGLVLFRDDPDSPRLKGLEAAVERLKAYVASASLQHTYTTYYGRSPSEPNVKAVLGPLRGGVEILPKAGPTP